MDTLSQNHQQPYAVIIGLDNIRGIYAARTLARHRVPVIGIASDASSRTIRTRACKEVLVANTGNDELVSTLQAVGPRLAQKAVLFPCSDRHVSLISQHREQLEQWFHIVLPKSSVVDMMLDKIQFYRYAQENDLPIPQTVFVSCHADVEQAVTQLTFPCTLKPPNSKAPRWIAQTYTKAFKARDADELRQLYNQYHPYADTLIVQEWIEGAESNLYSCNCYFDVNATPVAAFVSRKLRQWPPATGETCLGEACQNDIVLQETMRLFQSVPFQGLGYVEMKQDVRSGKYFIIEPNIGRPTARSSLAEALGIEMLYSMYCDALGWPLPDALQPKYHDVKWVHLRRDLLSALHYWRAGELSLKEWWSSWRGRKTYALFSWSDPIPFLGDVEHGVRMLLSHQERRKRKTHDTLQELKG